MKRSRKCEGREERGGGRQRFQTERTNDLAKSAALSDQTSARKENVLRIGGLQIQKAMEGMGVCYS